MADRYSVNIDVEWEGLNGKQTGTISDISVSGCFVLCSGEVEDGDYVKIHFPLSTGKKFEFMGEVTNHVFEIGFGVAFINQSEGQREFLEVYIDTISEE